MPFWCRRSTKHAEVVGRAEARRRREVAGHLVAPGAGERVLHDRHQLDVREAEVGDVAPTARPRARGSERAVVLERVAPPRAEMHLVDRHRLAQRVALRAALEPLRVRPRVLRAVHDRRVRRRHLGRERDRVGLDAQPAVLRAELELVLRPFVDAGDEELPDAGRAERAHRMQAAVPRVEVADDRDRARVRRPDGERGAGDAVDLAHVRAELLVELLVLSLAQRGAGRGRRASAGTRTGRAP